jgi:hypothetical protein
MKHISPADPAAPNMKHIYTLQPGEQFKFWNGRIIVAHPDRPPKIVHSDGTTEIVTPLPRSP